MASNDLTAAEAQWRDQFNAMKRALSELKLEPSAPYQTADDGLDDDDFAGYSSGTSEQDVWDFISDDEGEESSGLFDSVDDFEENGVDGDIGVEDTKEMFSAKCAAIAGKNGLAADDFQAQVSNLLVSGFPMEELQSHLTDLVGFDHLDFIISILADKDKITASLPAGSQASSTPSGKRLLSRAQREEALRQQDREHKSAPLAASYTRQITYPHIYNSYSAGNTLSATGKKYGLPVGSERLQFDKYEEYFIPAGKKGVLGPGQKIVPIKELDGLCRNTFRGYTTLNRMQSLAYHVAYKTSENMLICAPTGAVRV